MNIGSRVLGRSNWRRGTLGRCCCCGLGMEVYWYRSYDTGVLVFCLVMVAWGVRDHINFTDYGLSTMSLLRRWGIS